MRRIAKFHKVSLKEFMGAVKEEFPEYSEEDIQDIYESIELPKRATRGSAGYDFFSPFAFFAVICYNIPEKLQGGYVWIF